MWKRMIDRFVIAIALIDTAASIAVAWVLVVKLGWRLDSLLDSSTFDMNTSFVFYAAISGMALPFAAFLAWLAVGALAPEPREGLNH